MHNNNKMHKCIIIIIIMYKCIIIIITIMHKCINKMQSTTNKKYNTGNITRVFWYDMKQSAR